MSKREFLYTKHIRFPGPGFFREQAPSIVASTNATPDTITELALMGCHLQPPYGVQLVVDRKNVESFMRYAPSIPFEELAWPSRTLELFIDYPGVPGILAGWFEPEDFTRMGFGKVPGEGMSTHVLIQEKDEPVSIQSYYSLRDMMRLAYAKPSDMGSSENGLNKVDSTMMDLSALFSYKALELFNLGQFVKYSLAGKQPWRDLSRNRPDGLSLILSDNFNSSIEKLVNSESND